MPSGEAAAERGRAHKNAHSTKTLTVKITDESSMNAISIKKMIKNTIAMLSEFT
jgi:hypothetical protein